MNSNLTRIAIMSWGMIWNKKQKFKKGTPQEK
jgi:hypothetical protein